MVGSGSQEEDSLQEEQSWALWDLDQRKESQQESWRLGGTGQKGK